MINIHRFNSILLISMTLFGCTEQFLEKSEIAKQKDPDIIIDQVNTSASKTTPVLEDAYIIVYKDSTEASDVEDDVNELELNENVKTKHVYNKVFNGYSAILSPSALEKVKKNPKVDYVEKDQVMRINTQVLNPTWGLDRIDQVSLPLSTTYSYVSAGTGVDAYIIDTGILVNHSDFGPRAIGGFSSIGTSTNWIDQNGHGTHVAGTVGGNMYGVAKDIKLIAVRVLDAAGSGTTSGVIAGINWAISHHTTRPAVANMSLGGGASSALDLAVNNAIKDGIVMCVAAGNNSADAGRYSPARVTAAITVGATGAYPTLGINYDAMASYSNYGSVVDIFAPGTSIQSDWITSTGATALLSGTSMATPHVTGVAALYLAQNPLALPAQVQTYLKSSATKNKISGLKGTTTNSLLFTNF
ncbi:S8 family peptidase [Aquirufa sp. TARAVU-A1A]